MNITIKMNSFLGNVLKSVVLLIMLVSFSFPVQADTMESKRADFQDLEKHAYYIVPAIWGRNQGIVAGVNENEFGVGQECTRAQALTFLWRMMGKEMVDAIDQTFLDIAEDSYYYEAVKWGLAKGTVSGVSDSFFAPEGLITRGQFVSFLYRIAGRPHISGENPFCDVSNRQYYYDAVLWAVEHGIVYGTTTVTFEPDGICTREQAISFLWRFYIMQVVSNNQVYAVQLGLSPDNSGSENSIVLQRLIDYFSNDTGTTIFISKGEYDFEENGKQTIGSHCIKMQSNISIIGEGTGTILRPIGQSERGLDMFYFNDYVDYNEPTYLENCRFENFVIDGKNSSCNIYTSAGKGFMFNLFKACHWKNVIVKNTIATGFGVDCPIGGSMTNCIAINCGTGATTNNTGASGFGIGFGYSEDECFKIINCRAYDNKKFGFFFEHQGRFHKSKYQAEKAAGFEVFQCESFQNYYNYGGLYAMNVLYQECASKDAIEDGFYFENSRDCIVRASTSESEGNASFVVIRTNAYGGTQKVSNIQIENSRSDSAINAVKLSNYEDDNMMGDITIKDCDFCLTFSHVVLAEGPMKSLVLQNNTSDSKNVYIDYMIQELINENNSWNE